MNNTNCTTDTASLRVDAVDVKVVTWLILPVVICLSQRLSHACVSISDIQWNCEWLIKTVIVYLIMEFYMDNRSNSRANTCCQAWLIGRAVFIRYKSIFFRVYCMINNNWSNRMGFPAINHSSFCPISLMVVYWTTMAFTGNGGLGFDSGEGAW